MKIAAVFDLGSLGATEGPPTVYNWKFSGLSRGIVPGLLIFGLLGLRINRRASAWWIWVPMVAVATVSAGVLSLLLPSQVNNDVQEGLTAVLFGLAALWLLAGCSIFVRLGRWRSWFLSLAIMGLAAAICALCQNVGEDAVNNGPTIWILLGFAVPTISVALALAGRWHGRQFRPLSFTLWTAFWLVASSLLALTPFFIGSEMSNSGDIPVFELILAALVMAGIILAVVLPFLILSFSNSLYRERLGMLLHLEHERAPVPDTPFAASPVPQI